jgi:16S rRNA (uracil1498-N3)-methyltransferase
MKRFFTTDPAIISGEEAYHAIKVLRCQPGEQVETINGKGQLFSAVIESVQKDCIFLIEINLQKELFSNPNKLSVAIAPTKNPARLEWFLEKATEIGIDQIYPIITARTEKTNLKYERLKNIILAAVKQSKHLYIPTLHPIQSLEQAFSNFQINKFSNNFIAHCENDQSPFLGKVYSINTTALILIGPEGDFTPKEIEAALNNNYQPVSLGNSILRVETAGVVACAIVNSVNYEKQ